MQPEIKRLLLIFGVLGIITLIITGLIIYSVFLPGSNDTNNPFTPQPTTYISDEEGKFRLTPFQKTIIGKTTEAEVEENNKILQKKNTRDSTIYVIESATSNQTDEIITRNGTVVSERIDIFTNKEGLPPKIATYEEKFGQPERILNQVSSLGKHISAYIYAKKGVTFFVNRYTKTIYRIHTFVPVTLEEYLNVYNNYIQEAPSYPQERFR